MPYKRTIPIVCCRCGAHTLVRPSATGRYCSRKCGLRAVSDARTESRVAIACLVCGQTRRVKPSVLADGRGKYCSKACQGIGRRTHGETIDQANPSPEYRTWTGIKTRCLNPNDRGYPRYGGRGITICDRWRDSFEAFLADVGRRPSPAHSIDRINNDRGYEPGNVRWTTADVQSRNRRTVVRITYGEKTMTLHDWGVEIGISASTLKQRLRLGWSVERAFTTPARNARG